MSKKSIIAVFICTVLAFAGIAYFASSSSAKNTSTYVNPAFKEFIAAYTSGYVFTETTITIVLQEETINEVEIGKDLDNNLFEFSPSIKGSIKWIDKKTIEFKPAERLENNKTYKASFNLGKVASVSDAFKNFEFEFKTIKQAIEVSVDEFRVVTDNELEMNGTVETADVAKNELVEKIIHAQQNGNTLAIKWIHENNSQHRFTITKVMKGNGNVSFSYNGEEIDAKEKYSYEYVIPNANEFTLLKIVVANEPDQYIALQFSDKLDANQNLDGLIMIDGITTQSIEQALISAQAMAQNAMQADSAAALNNYDTYQANQAIAEATKLMKNHKELRFLIENNILKIYTSERYIDTHEITVDASLKNHKGKSLSFPVRETVLFEDLKPNVRLMGKGTILPIANSNNTLLFPFEGVNLSAVDVRITRVYENNMLQFLQINNMDGNQDLRRVGKLVVKKKIDLQKIGSISKNKWNKYALDLSSLIQAEPGALYNVRISFNKNYSTYNCMGDTVAEALEATDSEYETSSASVSDSEEEKDWDYYGYYDDYYDDYYYDDYNERDNPCSRAYYNNKSVTRNILASNIGLIAKRGNNGEITVITSDLVSAKPLSNVSIEAFDFQQQKLTQAITNSDGIATITTKQKPFVLIAKHGNERNYIKMEDGNSLSLSSFDIDGDEVKKGMKGFIYGERGVWRPGDSLYLSFILENKNGDIPQNYPASLELENPQGQLVQKLTKTQHVNGFYSFATKTEASAPTGVYLAKVKVGGVVFTKNIRIETIMPNRLKINLAYTKEKIYSTDLDLKSNLSINWLHGAPGKNLETKMDLSLTQIPTEFKAYKDYTFDNPTQNFYSETQTVFTGTTNDEGNVQVTAPLNDTKNAPGFLMANFTIRAFEEGGSFSTDRFSIPVSPFNNYVGVKTPETKTGSYYLETDADHIISLATVDEFGSPTSRSNIEVKVYKLDWRWWWDNYNQDLSSYIGTNFHEPIYSQQLTSSNGKASFKFRVNQPSWGRYLIYVKDVESGHACGKVVFVDWPSWAGKSPKGNEGSNVLTINTDKQEYNVGDKVKVMIPTSATGKVLVNIENGSHTVMSKWVDAKQGNTEYEFTVTKEMTPNIYVFAHFLQPHSQTINDLPIRMYGVASLMVKDENTVLKPKIITDAVWKPESKAVVKVSEENDKEMAYTLAIVDEGLLDITRFKTPSPWDAFYAKEALGVKTWDVFDNVIGAFGNAMMRILSIGGDDALNAKPENSAQRFKPMVRFIGPFLLKKGETASHTIDIPQYVGSVRVMVVAGNKGAYGNAEKAVPVRKPLMILSTLPRILSPNEEVDLPVTVFAMEKKVKQATITITTDKYILQAPSGSSQTINFTSIGDKVIHFKLKTADMLGVSKITIQAKGAGEVATETIEIALRANNPVMTDADEFVLSASKGLNTTYTPMGLSGTNKAYIELSTLPAINLSQRLEYLVQYPHGCVEQTTSSVFAGLYLTDLIDLNPAYKTLIDNATRAAINRLKSFQTPNGGFSYWPNLNEADNWGTTYAGHFLIEAKAKGYTLPYGLLDKWKNFQKQKAQNYINTKNTTYVGEDFAQAYRLYTLALAGAPELGAMNRLKEDKRTSNETKWRLAAAYAIAGQMEVAKKMAASITTKTTAYANYYYTYGSSERDDAMMLETMTLLKNNNNAFLKVKDMATKLGDNNYWMSTQTTAYSLMAIAKYAKLNNSNAAVSAEVVVGNDKTTITDFTKTKYKLVEFKNGNTSAPVKVTVKGGGSLFARLVKQGIPKAGNDKDKMSNLQLVVVYKTLNGANIDVTKLEQGTDFMAEVTIKNTGMRGAYKNLALSQLFASGWEIRSQRLDNVTYTKGDVPTYQDIRDDRVYSYFDLGVGQSKTFKVLLNASYTGMYYLPGVSCDAMYDNSISAHVAGKWVTVKRQGEVL